MRAWKPKRALDLIEREGRTRQWIARYCGINPLSLNHYLSGRRIPAQPIIKLVAQALNTTEEYLSGKDEVEQKLPEARASGNISSVS